MRRGFGGSEETFRGVVVVSAKEESGWWSSSSARRVKIGRF